MFCFDVYISLRRLQKPNLNAVLFVASASACVFARDCCVCLCVHTKTEIERYSDSRRKVHGCVMKPMITRLRDGYCSCDWHVPFSYECSFLSETCFSSVPPPPTPQKAMHLLLLHKNTKASLSWIGSVLGDNAWFAFNSWIWQAPL